MEDIQLPNSSQHLEKLSSCLGGTPFWQSFCFHAKIKENKKQLIFSSELSLNLVQDKLETQILWLIDFVILIVASVAYYHNTRGRKKNRLLVITITSSNEKNSWGKKSRVLLPGMIFNITKKESTFKLRERILRQRLIGTPERLI